MLKFLLMAALALHAGAAYAQRGPETETFPPHRDQALLVYHPRSQALLFIGGFPVIPDSTRSDVWKWKDGAWTRIGATGPGSRYFFQGGLNASTGNIELFGGTGIGEYDDCRGDVWSFDGNAWATVAATDVGTRDHHRMTYADHLGAFVLYGGIGADRKPDTVTWLLRNGTFTALRIPGPGVRYHSGMAYDANRKKVVLYGGGDRPDELWEFDGAAWAKKPGAANPGARFHHHMVYDARRKAVVLHGGWGNLNAQDPKNLQTPATWTWDGNVWKKIAEARVFPMAIAYDPRRQAVVAYGYNDGNTTVARELGMWELKDTWEKMAGFGAWSKADYLATHLAKNPNDLMALMPYARVLKSLNRLPEAEAAFRKIQTALPQNEKILAGLLDVLIVQGKYADVEAYLRQSEQGGAGRRDLYTRVAASLHDAKQYVLAAQYYEKALAVAPGAAEYYNLGCVYALAGNADSAFRALHQAAASGFNGRQNFERDPDLAALRTDARWPALAAKLK